MFNLSKGNILRIVSLVPSWTETLIDCGIEVVGRTRFCIHPKAEVASIPIVGGTKDWKKDLVMDLKPDLVLFDQEENSKKMVEECSFPWVSTHVTSLESSVVELKKLSDLFKNEKLRSWQIEAEKILQTQFQPEDLLKSPWVLEKSWTSIEELKLQNPIASYMIWMNPWMSVSEKTYIGSLLKHFGFGNHSQSEIERYPKLEELKAGASEMCFFSSEPYPFHKKKDVFQSLSTAWALVDGEFLSWYGVRSLKNLKQIRLSKI